jgi:N6-adenosine-specific RNA methylase IME4
MSDTDNGSLLWAAGGTRFHTILADCPWPSKSTGNQAKRHHWLKENMKPRYNTMKIADIARLPVPEIAHRDAVLVLWATWMHLPLAIEVMGAWGFGYATGMPWLKVCKDGGVNVGGEGGIFDSPHKIQTLKPIYGPGVWFQHCTELILIGRRGRPFGDQGNPRPARKGIVIATRQEHSRKPEELQEWIDAKFPSPKIELFARRPRTGWTCWGDELDVQARG